MSKKLNVTINGKEIKVAEGTNLIDAAESAGTHIPNLCYVKGMRGIGACRMCLVEVEGMKSPMIGCTTKVKEGMSVNTKTEDIEETRKFIIDLILSMHPLDCMTCTKAGVCTLQKYAYDYGIKESSYTRKKFGYPVDEANPFIKRDPDYCILCGKCVRACQEQGTNVLEFMGRGVGAKVATAMDKPLQQSECTFCGSCVDACPVNALLEADRWRKGREWDYTKTDSTCLSCGSGCDINISTMDGSTVKINSNAADGSAEKYICALGRFGFESSSSDARVTTPMKRVNGKLEEISWQDAVALAAEKLKASQDNTGIITTAGIPNQDAFVISKFASDVVKTKNIDSTASLYADADSMKYSDKVDLDASDVIVVAGLNPSQSSRILPAFDAAIRKRAARGAKVIVINAADTGLASSAAIHINADEASSLAHLAKGLIDKGAKAPADLASAVSGQSVSEDMQKAAELLSGAKSPVIFCAPSLFRAARNIALVLKVKVTAVPFEANARGVVTMGVTTEGKTYQEMIKGGVDVLYAIGEVPVSSKPDAKFIIAQTSYMTELAKEADLILPAATYIESEGTITGYLGRDKDVKKAVEPAGSARQHKDIVIDISKAAGTAIKASASEMKSAHGVSEPSFSTFEKKQGLDADPVKLSEAINSAAFNHSRLLWFKEAIKAV